MSDTGTTLIDLDDPAFLDELPEGAARRKPRIVPEWDLFDWDALIERCKANPGKYVAVHAREAKQATRSGWGNKAVQVGLDSTCRMNKATGMVTTYVRWLEPKVEAPPAAD